MKIRSIEIDRFRHLSDLKLDFTYPVGHSREGQILDKICFIGQSATGKTSILELIKSRMQDINEIEIYDKEFIFRYEDNKEFNGIIEFDNDGKKYSFSDSISIDNRRLINPASGGGALEPLISKNFKLIYLSAELIKNEILEMLSKNPVELLADENLLKNSKGKSGSENYLFEYLISDKLEMVQTLFSELIDFRKKFMQFASELIQNGNFGDFERLNQRRQNWDKENANPLKIIADKTNQLFRKLELELDLINTEYLIPFNQLSKNEVIPISKTSTGTKNLFFLLYPLLKLNTDNAMILMDEPERSLFPDIQVELMDVFSDIAPMAQLIVATHSPFIAASFEPEERFILYVDENGKVAVKRGESPVGDDPNDILRNDFMVDYYNEKGKAAYNHYLKLKEMANYEKSETEKNKILKELIQLGEKYNF